ncbi:MAG: ATP-grasp domain-containing protein, partial [Hyphomicrobiaceae bacterium]
GVFACHDATAELAARIGATLGLPHGDVATIARCNDKLSCRDFLAANGYKSVDYRAVASPSEVAEAASALGGHVVVKPRSSTGSLGVKICRTPDEAVEWAYLLSAAGIDSLIVEAYLDGPQFAVTMFDGMPLIVTQSHLANGQIPLVTGTDIPANISGSERSAITEFARSISSNIGCTRGPIFIELRRVQNQCHLIEINPRPAVHSPVHVAGATGINLYELCLKFACGLPYSIDDEMARSQPRAAALRFVIRDGISIQNLVGIKDAETTKNVESVFVFKSRLLRTGPASGSLDRVATVLAKAETVALAASSADEAIRKIRVIPEGKVHRKLRRFRWRLARRYDRLKSRLMRVAGDRAPHRVNTT